MMDQDRYRELQRSGGKLTDSEVSEGWHYCAEYDQDLMLLESCGLCDKGARAASKFKAAVDAATTRVHQMDAEDGFKDRHLVTILAALECGLATQNGAEFDALVMLRDAVEELRRGPV